MADDRKPFSIAVGLLRRTTPFLALNAAVYAGFFLAIVAWLGIFGGLAVLFSTRVELLAFIFLIIAIAGPGAMLAFARRYLLYLVQGAHIAVATTLLFRDGLPEGQGQIAYGRAMVQSRFRDVSLLFAVDRIVHGVISTFTRTFVRIVDFLPLGGGASNIARIGASVVNRSVSYVDEAILSYAIAREEQNVWKTARHGIILYAQAYKPILGVAVKVWLVGRVIFLAVLLVIGIPGVLLLLTFDAIWFQAVVIVATIMLAWLIVAATFEPFAAIYTLVTYHRAIEGVEVNAVWDQRLQQMSKQFRELVGKAQADATETDPLDQATVPPEALEVGGDGPPGGSAAGHREGGGGRGIGGSAGAGGGNALSGLRGATRHGGLGGLGSMVGGLLSQATQGQQAQQPAQQAAQQPASEEAPPQPPQPAPPASPPPPGQQEQPPAAPETREPPPSRPPDPDPGQ